MKININSLNGLSLAFLGDAVDELKIRRYLILKGTTNVNLLQNKSKEFLSAKAHAKFFKLMQKENVLNNSELNIYKKGRNSHPHTKAKNTNVISYQISTGLEALLGYLYLSKKEKRLNEIVKWMIKKVEDGETRQ